jgi:predicted nucleic acid-binding protein
VHDLIIAATARATGRTLLTTDRKAVSSTAAPATPFEDLPGVEVPAL